MIPVLFFSLGTNSFEQVSSALRYRTRFGLILVSVIRYNRPQTSRAVSAILSMGIHFPQTPCPSLE